ncbi:MAG: ABC transporter ATP-binding protein [Leadbetterella sp.]|nr:ABC transporter ATP-binding protein [Leadbetterella sp.]
MENAVIELEGLTKYYGSVKAVDNLSLRISKGEVFGLLGPNGAGKTTTILMMLGLCEPSAGQARVCGIDAARDPIAVKRKVAYMPDTLGFYDDMTALENLLYVGRLNGLADGEARARQTMELVGLQNELHKKTSAYSRGMKQRLGLADVLLREPEVIILDEPTLGIDPAGIRHFLTLIRQLSRQKGITVLLSSHHLHQVQQVCDRVGIFVGGKLLAAGNIESLARELFGGDSFVTTITAREPAEQWGGLLQDLERLEGLRQVETEGSTATLSCTRDITPEVVRLFVEKGLGVTGVYRKQYGLDEIYHRYFENNLN